jgi:REP element-mobilizing transposase RayT
MADCRERHHRRSIRLRGYDYSQAGAYFVTICTQDRAGPFGEVVDGEMRLNDAGRMVLAVWDELPSRFPTVEVDAFVIMPNHVHGIVVIADAPAAANVRAGLVPAAANVRAGLVPAHSGATTDHGATTRVAPTLGDVVGAFKSLTTVLYARGVNSYGWPPFCKRLWQRNYYEHIIRNEEALDAIRQYIVDNPVRWAFDRENPAATPAKSEDAWRT